MRRWTITLMLLLALVGIGLLTADRNHASGTSAVNRMPVIVELFTSQGCSSCPPADEVLLTLQTLQPVAGAEIIALSEHVDYWNQLGWADSFSSPIFSERQNRYARALGTNRIYTPQMVVDGQTEFIGSRAHAARQAVAGAASVAKGRVVVVGGSPSPKTQTVTLHLRGEQIPRVTPNDSGELWLAITEDGLTTEVRRGENAHRRLRDTAVVRQLQPLRDLPEVASGLFVADTRIRLAPDWQRNKLRAVAFVQERTSRRILVAGKAPLATSSPPS